MLQPSPPPLLMYLFFFFCLHFSSVRSWHNVRIFSSCFRPLHLLWPHFFCSSRLWNLYLWLYTVFLTFISHSIQNLESFCPMIVYSLHRHLKLLYLWHYCTYTEILTFISHYTKSWIFSSHNTQPPHTPQPSHPGATVLFTLWRREYFLSVYFGWEIWVCCSLRAVLLPSLNY